MSRRQVLSTILIYGALWMLGGLTNLSAQCLSGNCDNGRGTYVYPSGARYTGQFVAGQIHGKGILVFSNGDIYKGQWKNNYREGKGELNFKTGDTYSGEFQQSQFHGKGIMKYKDGDSYLGNWKADQANGEGIYRFDYGDRYEGSFRKGKFHGEGNFTYTDGSRFEGFWINNQKHGDGILISPEGEVLPSNWTYGTERIEQKQIAANYESPEGDMAFVDCNTIHCDDIEGVFYYEDGSYFKGHFIDGLPNGEGVCYYKNGDKYIGGWKHHSPHGKGVMYYTSGRAYGAIWSTGKPVKELELHQSIDLKKEVLVEKSASSKIWAVIIGIAEYSFMPKLKYTDDDAHRMYDFFKSPEGGSLPDRQIKLIVNSDATRSNIVNTLQEVYLRADDNDVILLYYSGHGLKGSFIPIDYNGYENKLHHEDIRYIFDQSQAGVKMCLADACYSGSFGLDDGTLARDSRDLTTSTAFLMSSTSQEVSMEGGGLDQGIFSHYLLRALKGEADTNMDKQISIQELYDFVYRGVRNSSDNTQSPVITGLYDRHVPISILPTPLH